MTFATPMHDVTAEAIVGRLARHSRRQFQRAIPHFVTSYVRSKLMRNPYEIDHDFLRDKLVALDPAKCALAYTLCRALGATRVAEVGTSFGASTIYLAAAVRDNGGGTVYGTEYDPTKVAAARKNLAEANLGNYARILQGDALETLRGVEAPIDFMLIDIWIPIALPALEIVRPKLRKGAIVLCDNTQQFAREYADYLAYVRAPENGFRTTTIPGNGGLELSTVT